MPWGVCSGVTPLIPTDLPLRAVTGILPCMVPSCLMMTAVASGGSVCVKGEYLVVEKSDDVTLYIDVETGYRRRHFRAKQGDVHKKPLAAASRCADLALKRICFASGTTYENLKADHIADWTSWNTQAILSIDGKEDLDWEYAKYKLLCDLHPQATLPKIKKEYSTHFQKNIKLYSVVRDILTIEET